MTDSYQFLGIDTSSWKVVRFKDPAVSYSLKALRDRMYWMHCNHYVERWEWLYSTDDTAKKHEFYRKYCGRTGSVWKSEYAELSPTNWNLPLIETGVNTQQPSPWNNAIHLRNSKDGSTLDEVYFAPRIAMKPPCVLNFDAYFPALNTTNYPNGTYIALGFEVNSGGYLGTIYALEILSDGTTVTVRLKGLGIRDGSGAVITKSISGLVTDDWRGFKLILTRRWLKLYQGTTSGQGYPLELVDELPITLDYVSYVTPFFANESSAIVSGVKIGQFQAFEINPSKSVRKVIDVSSISAGGYAESDVIAFPKEAALTVKVTYSSSASKGIRVYILACSDYQCSNIDSENTTDAFTYFEPSFTAEATRQKTVNLDLLPKYGKIRVRNLDGSYATGRVQVWVHEVYE
ncbi:hypothetical protein J7K27_02500 [Candidatus Bathyarchaeota archaeon]|nr:hypothetical protein [Candidatus Bathyarchaeota archaeon]